MKKLNFNKEEIIKRVYEFSGQDKYTQLLKIKVLDKYITAYDVAEERDVYFNFPEIDYDNLFDFGDVKVDKEKFFKLLGNLDTTLFMNIRKIRFLTTENETSFFRRNDFGPTEYLICSMREDSEILVNVFGLKRILKGEGGSPSKSIISWLIYELVNDRKENPLMKNGEISFKDDKETLIKETADIFNECIASFDFDCFEI